MPVALVVLVPVEVLARAVLPEQAVAARVLLPIRPRILQARPGAAGTNPASDPNASDPSRSNDRNQNRSPLCPRRGV